MRKPINRAGIALAASLMATGCVTDGVGPKQGFGTLGAAAAGGLAGAQVGNGNGKLAAVALGTLLGAFIGSEVGSSLDKADELYAQEALRTASRVPVGQPVTWNNGSTGNSGVVVPTRDGYSYSGNYCREYQHTVYIGGRAQKSHGKACREPDGSWRTVG